MKKRSRKCLMTLMMSGILTVGGTTMTAYAVSPSARGTVVTPTGDVTGPETITIENGDVPLAQMVIEDGAVPLAAIPDQQVPLASTPGMGDTSNGSLWLMLFAGSGLGIAAMELLNRRKLKKGSEEA